MCVEITRECRDTVLVTIRGDLGVTARTPLFEPHDDAEKGEYVFATDSVTLSLTDAQAEALGILDKVPIGD